jgi:hypothetical protein
MSSDWREVEGRLIGGNEDFKTIRFSILKQAEALSEKYNFRVFYSERVPSKLVSKDSLNLKLKQYLEQSKLSFMTEQRRIGRSNETDFDTYIKSLSDENEQKKLLNYVKLNAWRDAKGYFVEILCLLSYLSKFQPTDSRVTSYNIFQKVGPIPIIDDGKKRYLWYQPTVKETKTGMVARPDIVITDSEKEVNHKTIVNMTECKCREQITASDIRSEFGKAYDLRVDSFTVVVFYKISEHLKNAALQLGIELVELGLYTPDRQKYLSGEISLEQNLSLHLIDGYRKGFFSKKLTEAASIALSKAGN